jgi:hypothetical protein
MKRLRSPILTGVMGVLLAAGAARAADIKLSVHGGLSIPKIRGKETDIFTRGFKSRQGLFMGLAADVGLTPRLSLALALNYNSQGGLRKGLQPITMELPPGLPVPPGTILYADFRNETILDYLEVPVMARFWFGKKVRFFVNAGPYVGLLVRARALTSGMSAIYLDEAGTQPIIIPPATDPLIVDLGASTNVLDSLKRMNFGLAGGGGILYSLGAVSLCFEAHFQLGLSTLQKDVETDGQSQTGALVISLGVLFPLARNK